METSLFLRIEIIVLGLFSIGLLSSVIYYGFKEKKLSSFLIGILGFLLLGGFPVWGLYVNLNKYLTKPEPANLTEVYINGVHRMQYQDTAHLCNPSDAHSPCFTSFMPLDGDVLQTDTCTICGRRFLEHYTIREHRYYEAVAYGTDAYYNSLSANLVQPPAQKHHIEPTALWHSGIPREGLRPYTKKKQFARMIFCIFAFYDP